MIKTNNKMPSFDDLERAERIKEVFFELHKVNNKYPVIVEGKKDSVALRKLGVIGEIIILHNGKNIYDFCEDIAERFKKVVILMDWDVKGENLYKLLTSNLEGRWEEFSAFREIIKILCQKDVKDIEGIPKLLLRLEGRQF